MNDCEVREITKTTNIDTLRMIKKHLEYAHKDLYGIRYAQKTRKVTSQTVDFS